jgi:hypothetical protein
MHFGVAMSFSTADWTVLRLRCSGCRQYTERLVTLLLRKDYLTCSVCGAQIDLKTPVNSYLIKETAESCQRIGAGLARLLRPELQGGPVER